MRGLTLLLAAALSGACANEKAAPAQPPVDKPARLTLERTDAPSPPVTAPAGEPFLSSTEGSLIASWLETGADRATLKFARFHDGAWSTPVDIASGDDFFVNWADVPSVVALGGTRMVAHWLQKSGEGTYSYDILLAVSDDRGNSWRPIGSPHDTEVDSEYGFVSIEPDGAGGAWIAWLDGRAMSGHHGAGGGSMQARVARLTSDDRIIDEKILDDRTCECCQTGMTVTAGMPLIVWRDRSDEEVRDVVLSRREEGGDWSAPVPVQSDGWKIPGCPVNGPQIASDGQNVVVAWFTAANDESLVKMVFSDDGGLTLSEPVVVSEANPIGRVDVLARDGYAIITWIEQAGSDGVIRAALVDRRGVQQRVDIDRTSSSRSSGFPRAAINGDDAWIAWTDAREGRENQTVRIAKLEMVEEE